MGSAGRAILSAVAQLAILFLQELQAGSAHLDARHGEIAGDLHGDDTPVALHRRGLLARTRFGERYVSGAQGARTCLKIVVHPKTVPVLDGGVSIICCTLSRLAGASDRESAARPAMTRVPRGRRNSPQPSRRALGDCLGLVRTLG